MISTAWNRWSWPRFFLGLLLLIFSSSLWNSRTALAKAKSKSKEAHTLEAVHKGVQAFQAGDYALAHKTLGVLADKGALSGLRISDYVLFVLGESEALLGDELGEAAGRRLWQNAVLHLGAVEKTASSALSLLARVRGADCLLKLAPDGRNDGPAAASYRAALSTGRSDVDAAALRFRLAEIAARAGKKSEARDLFRRLYIDFPLHPLAEPALSRFLESDATAKLDPSEHIARAKNLLASRRFADALFELGKVPKDLPANVRDEVEYLLGTSMYRMRRNYAIAAEKLLAVAPRKKGEEQAEAMFHGARALSRAEQDDAAIAGYRAVVKAHPGSRYAAEASFLIGWLDWNRGRYPEAISSLAETVKRFSGRYADDARWYIGLSHYFLKEDSAALSDFEQLSHRSGMLGQKGSYFAGLAELRLGHKEAAQNRWRKLNETHPLTYYSMLSRIRLRELGIQVGPFGDVTQTQDGLPQWLDSAAPTSKTEKADAESQRLQADARLRPIEELIAVGLLAEAGQELRRIESDLMKEYGAARTLPLLVQLYNRAQQFRRPHLLADSYGAVALHRDPHRVVAARPFWEAKYPLAYREFIEKYAPTGENPMRYLYAIMQKESAYNPYDVSFADAIGLLQMIPPTSRKVARHIGRPYTDDVLYDPEGNIQFGAWYIGRLLKKFKGQVALGAGSFNAGPAAMVRWLGRSGDRPLDEFIELCPYSETREYMKKLLDIYAHYVFLWDKEDYLPSLNVDKAYLSGDGIDY